MSAATKAAVEALLAVVEAVKAGCDLLFAVPR